MHPFRYSSLACFLFISLTFIDDENLTPSGFCGKKNPYDLIKMVGPSKETLKEAILNRDIEIPSFLLKNGDSFHLKNGNLVDLHTNFLQEDSCGKVYRYGRV